MREKKNIIDSHVHLDLIHFHYPKRLQWLIENNVTVVSWAFFDKVTSVSSLKKSLKNKSNQVHALSDAGLNCYYLAGIHPRSIPSTLKPEQVEKILQPFMEDPLCRGIGEIGLETGDAKEKEILLAQLEFGRTYHANGKVIGIHTPRLDKDVITQATLKLLTNFSDLKSRIIVDHCTIDTVTEVLKKGVWVGITLSKVKTSWTELKKIISICSNQIDKIICNTDSGSAFYDDLVKYYQINYFPQEVNEKLFHHNAARFFCII
jgi:hypothetical protein